MIKHLREILKYMNDSEQRLKDIPVEQGEVDSALNDILHVVEFNNFNAYEGYKLAKLIQDKRKIRRELKDEYEETTEIVEMSKRIKGTLETYKNKLGQLKAKQEAKTYKVRVMQDVFGDVIENNKKEEK
jgi:hypothetical protein